VTETSVADPAAEFAQLMSGAQQAADVEAGADPEAPYGWTVDPKTGERRPKKSAGRPRKPPSADELRDAGPPPPLPPDEAPGKPPRARGKPKDDTADPGGPPMPKGGMIAAGVNKLYRRAGKLIRAMDEDIGQAIIDCTRVDPDEAEDERELTVGEAWENLARVNPRIRKFILSAIAGGAWGDLVMAHAPIGLAIVMKPWVQRMIPWKRLIESVAEPDEDTPDGEGGLPGGMTAADVGDMEHMAAEQARRMAHRAGIQVSDAELADAVAKARRMDGVPPAFRRQQPKHKPRAQRTGAR
jgi:hypothetical protein